MGLYNWKKKLNKSLPRIMWPFALNHDLPLKSRDQLMHALFSINLWYVFLRRSWLCMLCSATFCDFISHQKFKKKLQTPTHKMIIHAWFGSNLWNEFWGCNSCKTHFESSKLNFLFDLSKEFLLYFLFLVMSAIFVSQWGVHT